MQQVYTDLGPGQIIESQTTRGRTEYRVAGQDFDVWLPGTKLGFAPVDESNSVDLPYNPEPQYGVGALTDSTIQPIHEIDPDKRTSPADSITFEDRSRDEGDERGQPGPNPDLFAKGASRYAGYGEGLHPDDPGTVDSAFSVHPAPHSRGRDLGAPTPHQSGSYGLDWDAPERSYGNDGYGPGDDEDDNEPAFRPGHEPDYQQQGKDWNRYQQQEQHNKDWQDAYHAEQGLDETGTMNRDWMDGGFDEQEGVGAMNWGGWQKRNLPLPENEDPRIQRDQRHQEWLDSGAPHHGYRTADVLEGTPTRFTPDFIVNDTDDEHFQERVDVEEDERETTDPDGIVHFADRREAIAPALAPLIPAVARGVGMGAAQDALGLGQPEQPSGDPSKEKPQVGLDPTKKIDDAIDTLDNNGHPLPLPDLGYGWGDMTGKQGSYQRPAGLDDRYADIVAAHDPYDKVAQFRHDPEAFINRVGHAEFEGLHPRMATYMDQVEGDAELRTAAWKDVRAKAMRLRREGRVHVKDVDTDRIYATVQGDHGTYETMIKKGGAFGGFGGGHAISNWHCACEWGKWAFQRRYTYIGRLCSHGYAAYLEMQSAHMKGKKRQTKYPKVRRSSIHTAEDQTTQDWKIDDTGDAKGDLDEIRQWAETPQEEDFGNMEQRVEDIRDAVEDAREKGVDADQLVASLIRHAAPEEDDVVNNLADVMGVEMPADSGPGLNVNPFAGGGLNPSQIPGVEGGPNTPGATVPGGPMNPGNVLGTPGTTPGQEDVSAGGAGGAGSGLGQGTPTGDTWGSNPTHTVQEGETLSGIAGDDYGSVTNADGSEISNKDLITPGQQLDLSAVGGSTDSGTGADVGTALGGSPTTTPTSGGGDGGLGNSLSGGSDSGSSSSGSGSWWGKSSGRRTAAPGDPNDLATNPVPPVSGQPAPAPTPGGAPAAPGMVPPAGAAPQANDDVAQQAATMGTGANTEAVTDPDLEGFQDTSDASATPEEDQGLGPSSSDYGTGNTPADPGTGNTGMGDMGGMTDMMGGIGDAVGSGMDMASDIGSAVGDIASSIGGIFGSRDLMADRDWMEAAYGRTAADLPYGAGQPNHKPFNGSGGYNIEQWGQSKDNVKENYTDNIEDVTEEPKKTHLKDLDSMESERVAGMGIRRAGKGPQRAPVTPEVVRERKPRSNRHIAENIPEDFDPLAPRTAASFDDHQASGDVVAQFHAKMAAGETAIDAAPSSQYDDFTSSPVFQQVAQRTGMQRTAGRNYSLAEQAELIREGDRGGAGNLDQLDLKGTHYEAMNSVGLW